MHFFVIAAVFIALLISETDKELFNHTLWLGPLSATQSLLMIAGVFCLLWSLMQIVCKALLRRMVRAGHADHFALSAPARLELVLNIVIVGVYVFFLTMGGWAKLVYVQWGLDRWVLVDEMVLLLPYVLLVALKLYCLYPVNRHVKEYIMTGQLMEGLPARPVWTRRQYLSFQLRHGLLIILVPLLLICAWRDIVYMIPLQHVIRMGGTLRDYIPYVREALVGGGALVIFVFSPLLLRRIWITRELPFGPLRERLEEFCQRIGLGYRDILLWDTYSAVANAAVMGLLRPIRYVLLSDNLVENMSDEQIEAVFGHEAGHVKHHHIAYLVLFVLGSMSLAYLLLNIVEGAVLAFGSEYSRFAVYQDYIIYGFIALLGAGWFLLFGWVSRRFEWQADVHAALAVNDIWMQSEREDDPPPEQSKEQPTPTDKLSPARQPIAPADGRLGQQGAYIMGNTLRRIAMLNGISLEARSWRHASIANRMEFLRRLSIQPGALRRFQRQIIWLKWGIILIVLMGLAGSWLLGPWLDEGLA